MSETQPPEHEDDATGEALDGEFSLARSNALIPLLIMFAVTILAIVVVIVRARPVVPPEGALANKAFGPADFPLVFAKEEGASAAGAPTGGAAGVPAMVFPVPAPPFTEGIFPCMQCHEGIPPNPERREFEGMHSDIVFHHDEEHRWCLDCHDMNNRDQLHLANGAGVPFTESYRLCGQCHGTQYRDWRSGIHGKRTGYWDGSKRYLLCVHCHNPHSPRFAALQPLPPPVRPQFLRSAQGVVTASGELGGTGTREGDGDAAHTR